MRKAVLLFSFFLISSSATSSAAEDTTSLLIDATSKLVRDVKYLKGEVSSLRTESKLLKVEIQQLKNELKNLKLSVSSLEGRMADIDRKVALFLEVRRKIKTNRKIIVGTFLTKERAEKYKRIFIKKTGFPAGVKQDSCRYGVCYVVYTYGNSKELNELRKLGYRDAFFTRGRSEQGSEQRNEQTNIIIPNSSDTVSRTERQMSRKKMTKKAGKHTFNERENL